MTQKHAAWSTANQDRGLLDSPSLQSIILHIQETRPTPPNAANSRTSDVASPMINLGRRAPGFLAIWMKVGPLPEPRLALQRRHAERNLLPHDGMPTNPHGCMRARFCR